MKIKNFLFIIAIFVSGSIYAAKDENALAVHLLSYLAQDYGEAVKNGEIISQEEYQEQLDFVEEVVRISEDNGYGVKLKQDILELKNAIMTKGKVPFVSDSATKLKSNILEEFSLLTYPENKINIIRAEQLFRNNCMSCHGANGFGDGEAGVGLEPAPTNFHDLDRMSNVSPYGAYNTVSLGVEGTGMAAHDYLSEEDRWSLAYYITSLRFQGIDKIKSLNLGVKLSSSLSDNEIKKSYNISDDEFPGVLASIRDVNSDQNGEGGHSGQLDLHLSKAIKDLKQSLVLYKAGRVKEARNMSLTAYLQGIEPVEGILKSADENLVPSIESGLSKYRSLLGKQSSDEDLQATLAPILTALERSMSVANAQKTSSSSFLMSFGVVIREAIEAGLIIFLLLGLTRKSQAQLFDKHIHTGWLTSLVLGIIIYFIVDTFFSVSGKMVESIEGYTALIASGLLFYVGYWMHKNTDIQKIKAALLGAVQSSMQNKKGITLFVVAFTACFREVFETILFLKILVLDGHKSLYVGIGAVSAILLAVSLISVALKYSIKMNFKYLFRISTILILTLSTIFLGKGIGALQKTGALNQTVIGNFTLPSLGFNSTLEVILAQSTMVVLIAGFLFMSCRQKLFNKALSK